VTRIGFSAPTGQPVEAQRHVAIGTRTPVAAQHGLHSGRHLAWAERLGHVVISAHAESDELVDLFGSCGDEDDVGVAETAQLAQDFKPVDPGQHHVQEHQVRRTVAYGRQRRLSVGSFRDVEPIRFQVAAQHPCGCAVHRRRPAPCA